MPVNHPPSAREGAETTQGCVERLSRHATQLSRLVRLCDPSMVIDPGDATPQFTSALHQDVRLALRRDYDAGDQRALSVVHVLTQSALYGAYAELSPGRIPRSSRMLAEARRALRVLEQTLTEVQQRGIDQFRAPTPDRSSIRAR